MPCAGPSGPLLPAEKNYRESVGLHPACCCQFELQELLQPQTAEEREKALKEFVPRDMSGSAKATIVKVRSLLKKKQVDPAKDSICACQVQIRRVKAVWFDNQARIPAGNE